MSSNVLMQCNFRTNQYVTMRPPKGSTEEYIQQFEKDPELFPTYQLGNFGRPPPPPQPPRFPRYPQSHPAPVAPPSRPPPPPPPSPQFRPQNRPQRLHNGAPFEEEDEENFFDSFIVEFNNDFPRPLRFSPKTPSSFSDYDTNDDYVDYDDPDVSNRYNKPPYAYQNHQQQAPEPDDDEDVPVYLGPAYQQGFNKHPAHAFVGSIPGNIRNEYDDYNSNSNGLTSNEYFKPPTPSSPPTTPTAPARLSSINGYPISSFNSNEYRRPISNLNFDDDEEEVDGQLHEDDDVIVDEAGDSEKQFDEDHEAFQQLHDGYYPGGHSHLVEPEESVIGRYRPPSTYGLEEEDGHGGDYHDEGNPNHDRLVPNSEYTEVVQGQGHAGDEGGGGGGGSSQERGIDDDAGEGGHSSDYIEGDYEDDYAYDDEDDDDESVEGEDVEYDDRYMRRRNDDRHRRERKQILDNPYDRNRVSHLFIGKLNCMDTAKVFA